MKTPNGKGKAYRGSGGKSGGQHPAPRRGGRAAGRVRADIAAPTGPVSTGDTARDAVHTHLASQVKHYPNLDIRGVQLPPDLDPRDAALAHAIDDIVVRRWTTLERIVGKKTGRAISKLDPPVRAALMAATAQLLLLDRVPAHAAVNHAVQWTKVNVNPGAATVVNAVLRKITALVGERRVVPLTDASLATRAAVPLDAERAVELVEPVMPDDERLIPVAFGMPAAMWRALVASVGEPAAKEIAVQSILSPPTVLFTKHAIAPVPHTTAHEEPGHAVFTGSRLDLITLLNTRTDVWVQDASSTSAIRAAGALGLSSLHILDLCAGQGTKTRQLAAAFTNARITATDIDATRFATLHETFIGHPRVTVIEHEAVASLPPADMVLLDVPCSNSGVLSRRPEAKHRFDDASVGTLVKMQREIIRRGVERLSPGGVLVYATCSLDPRENAEQVAWACAMFNLTVSHGPVTNLPRGVTPASHRDGSFHAVLRK